MHTDRRPYSPEWDYMLILKTQDFFFNPVIYFFFLLNRELMDVNQEMII